MEFYPVPELDNMGEKPSRHPVLGWRTLAGKDYQMKCRIILFQRLEGTVKFRFVVTGEEQHKDSTVEGEISHTLQLTTRKNWFTHVSKKKGTTSSVRMVEVAFGFDESEANGFGNDIVRVEILVPKTRTYDKGSTLKIAMDWAKALVDARLLEIDLLAAMNA